MGLPQAAAPPHLYPQQLQLKLYQAFIFSIPILFSIILFLLFYLFYLKRRASSISSPPHIIPGISSQATPYHASSICQIVLKEELKDKLPIVLFDEELMTKDSQCCVCLGEFEIEEEVLQIPSCKHVFHINCIHHWLHSNSTCPLCRCYVIFPTTKFCTSPLQSSGPMILPQSSANSHHPQNMTSEPQQQEDVGAGSTEQFVIPMEGPASVTTQLRDSSSLPEVSISMESGRGSTNGESVILHIRTHSPRRENLPLHEVEIGR
uniref:RING-type E3 ubiquitin transferase n=1 Tax=Populus davidiana TaxID=266767 RepID=A0A6M2EXP7_9ROSI